MTNIIYRTREKRIFLYLLLYFVSLYFTFLFYILTYFFEYIIFVSYIFIFLIYIYFYYLLYFILYLTENDDISLITMLKYILTYLNMNNYSA